MGEGFVSWTGGCAFGRISLSLGVGLVVVTEFVAVGNFSNAESSPNSDNNLWPLSCISKGTLGASSE